MKEKKQILIVEDEMIVAEDLKRTLGYLGFAVTSIVSSAKEAIEEVEKNKPDLVLTDIKLRGDIDGVEAADQIRERFNIPIIYITALADDETLQRAKITEPFGYIHKPIEEKELHSTIEIALYRHKMERKLKESEKRYRLIFDGSRDAIFITGEDSRFTDVNEATSVLTGYSREELRKMAISDLHEAADLDAYKNYFHRIMAGEQITSEAKILRKDGTRVDTEFSNRRITIGGVPYMHTVARDITERKKAEEEKEKLKAQLIQSEKMVGIGTMAGGIAHEFNNLLQIMRGHVEFAQKTRKPDDVEEALDIVIRNSDRVAKIIKDLLTFSSQEVNEKEPCDITEPIESVLSLIEGQLEKQNIKVVRKYEGVPEVEISRGEMRQVFLNMATNARDAMLPGGGKLEIAVEEAGENVEVSFTDTGKGIEEENLKKVFEPFYTTKGAFGGGDIPGIGLGLSVSYGIVQRHGGTIEVESEVKKGTTFRVKLPVRGEKPGKKVIKREKRKKIKKSQTLNTLVVDDEEEICRMLTKCLSIEGHRVKPVTTGRKAISLVKKEFFDVVFLDIVMPGIPSVEILEKIKEISPKTKVVIITGKLMDNNLIRKLMQKSASGYLQKPFRIEEIIEIIDHLLK